MLIKQNLMAVLINDHHTGRALAALVSFIDHLHTFGQQAPLDITHVGDIGDGCGIAVPARIECQDILVEHALEKPDHGATVFQVQPVLGFIAGKGTEAQLDKTLLMPPSP